MASEYERLAEKTELTYEEALALKKELRCAEPAPALCGVVYGMYVVRSMKDDEEQTVLVVARRVVHNCAGRKVDVSAWTDSFPVGQQVSLEYDHGVSRRVGVVRGAQAGGIPHHVVLGARLWVLVDQLQTDGPVVDDRLGLLKLNLGECGDDHWVDVGIHCGVNHYGVFVRGRACQKTTVPSTDVVEQHSMDDIARFIPSASNIRPA
jgi:hypothetical protein